MSEFTRSTFTFLKSHAWVKGCLAGVVGMAILSPMVGAFAQLTAPPSHSDLREYQGAVGSCRRVNTAQISVYSTSDLEGASGTQIGTFTEGTVIYLTGVVRQIGDDKIVQVYQAGGAMISSQPVGWVAANGLALCSNPMQ